MEELIDSILGRICYLSFEDFHRVSVFVAR
jgi:hypothetical protein